MSDGPALERALVLVLIDGAGDVSIPSLDNVTPLQRAHTPFMDAIARSGRLGLLDAVEPGLACGSDTAHLSLLGYPPYQTYRGRGAFESLGAGLAMRPGDVAFKCNFATMDPADPRSLRVLRRRADRVFEAEGPVLCAALDGLSIPGFPEHSLRVRYATEHRAGLVLAGPGLTDRVVGTDPLKDGLDLVTPVPSGSEWESQAAAPGAGPSARGLSDESAQLTCRVLWAASQEARRVLASHPTNARRRALGLAAGDVLLLRGAGSFVEVPSFRERHGLAAGVVAPTRIIAGLAATLGMARLEADGATGDYRSDLSAKMRAAAQAVQGGGGGEEVGGGEVGEERGGGEGGGGEGGGGEGTGGEGGEKGKAPQPSAIRSSPLDFVMVHIKAVDDAGHDRLTLGKVRLLEAVDKAVGQLVRRLEGGRGPTGRSREFFVAVTSDHSTPVEGGDHSFEPVPFALAAVEDVVAELGGAAALARTAPLDEIKLSVTMDDRRTSPRGMASETPYVSAFDEVCAARGSLGRFPGSQVMTLVQHVLRGKSYGQ